jgi:ubiquinone/menaquinone biosynthesis C-methylase UbiE
MASLRPATAPSSVTSPSCAITVYRRPTWGRILEMGVGLGRLMVHLFPFRAELHGCDVTAPVLEWTRSKLGQRIELRLTNLEPSLPYPDAHFDFVYANSVLTHIPCAMMSQWAAELRRVVRPGGMVIVSVLDPNHYLRHSRTENTIQHTIVRGATAGTWRRGY